MFFFIASFNLILPEMNTFISALGGASEKGFIIALFTISAGISRPFSGKLADYIGRKAVMSIGIAVACCICLLYPLCYSVWFLLILRFFHGFSAGFFPTGATALITDVLPAKVRGTGMGLWGTFISLGIGVGQGLSTWITESFGQNGLFFTAAALTLLSYTLLIVIRETLPNPQRFKFNMLQIKRDEIIEKAVIPVAIVMFLSAVCSGIIFVLSSDIAGFLHIENKGSFFVYYVISTIGVRLVTGKISDHIGRRETLLIGIILLAISMLLIGFATTPWWFTFSSIIFGIATGTSSPTIFAWTADLSPDHRRGIGAGTMFIALEFGILFGSLMTNFMYTNKQESVRNVFIFGSVMALLTAIYLVWHIAKRPSKT